MRLRARQVGRFAIASASLKASKLFTLDEAGGALRSNADDGMNKLYERFDEATLAHAHALHAKILRSANLSRKFSYNYALI